MLNGKKVTLRPLKIEDSKFTLELRYDVEANKNLLAYPYPVNIENEKQWIENLYPKGVRENIYFAIEQNSSKDFVGYLSLQNINYINRNGDFGIILLKKYRGQDYSREAMKLFFSYIFDQINLRKIKLGVLKENDKAIKIYESLDFKEEGTLKEHVYQDGKYKDLVLMGLLSEDFKNNV
ncbi:MAG: GNAT family N-acetyltransferase [Candidatus Cloacimonetes bacterium]|nr:GNAT family N-acetyltransferase [Candidatus Cloacimonadota bacterium]